VKSHHPVAKLTRVSRKVNAICATELAPNFGGAPPPTVTGSTEVALDMAINHVRTFENKSNQDVAANGQT
jgi:hypothetical protein